MLRSLSEGVLCGIVTANKNEEIVQLYSAFANSNNIPYYCTSKQEYSQQLIIAIGEQNANAVFVFSYPWRIKKEVLDMPEYGFINFHPGMLPEMRGADPIFESIRNGKEQIGLCAHRMDEGFDTGPVYIQETFPLTPEQTYGMVTRQVAYEAERMAGKLIQHIKEGTLPAPLPQNEHTACYWPKVGMETVLIDWQEMDAAAIKALVRACNPISKGAYAALNGWKICICDVSDINLEGDTSHLVPGTVLACDPQNGMIVSCRNGKALKLETVYLDEGILPGYKLGYFGIQQGMQIGNGTLS